jgi:hypothetical protein
MQQCIAYEMALSVDFENLGDEAVICLQDSK